jgi:hypothetical protein
VALWHFGGGRSGLSSVAFGRSAGAAPGLAAVEETSSKIVGHWLLTVGVLAAHKVSEVGKSPSYETVTPTDGSDVFRGGSIRFFVLFYKIVSEYQYFTFFSHGPEIYLRSYQFLMTNLMRIDSKNFKVPIFLLPFSFTFFLSCISVHTYPHYFCLQPLITLPVGLAALLPCTSAQNYL